MRKRFRNIYYQFKPDYIYWCLVILGRKFCLSITLIMFNKNSTFQLAAALLVCFLCYSMQVRSSPYMSPGEFEQTIKDHETSAAAGKAIHVKLRSSIGDIEARGRKRAHKNVMSATGKVDTSAVLGLLTTWFFNYNTTEALLLFSAVIVSLMGLMFASIAASPGYYTDSTDAITSVVIGVVSLSIIYFLVVVIGEIFILYTEDVRRKELEKRTKAEREKGRKGTAETRKKDLAAQAAAMTNGDMLALTGPMEASVNPLFLENSGASGINEAIAAQEDIPDAELWRLFQSSFIQIQDEIAKVSHNVAACKVAQQKLEAAAMLLAEASAQKPRGEGERPSSISLRARRKAEVGSTRDLGSLGSSSVISTSPTGGARSGFSPSLGSSAAADDDGGSSRPGPRPLSRGASGRAASLQSMRSLKK